MSHFRTPGPPTRGKRRIAHLRLWLVMLIGSAWVQHGPLIPPGPPGPGNYPGVIRCPECDEPAKRQSNGQYECPNYHIYTLLSNGDPQRVD